MPINLETRKMLATITSSSIRGIIRIKENEEKPRMRRRLLAKNVSTLSVIGEGYHITIHHETQHLGLHLQ